MTKFNADWYPEVIPGFDALALKEKIQAEILEKTEGMTDEEVCEYFRKGSEEFQNDIKLFRRVFDVQQESGN